MSTLVPVHTAPHALCECITATNSSRERDHHTHRVSALISLLCDVDIFREYTTRSNHTGTTYSTTTDMIDRFVESSPL